MNDEAELLIIAVFRYWLEKMKYNVWIVLNKDQDESIKELEKKLKRLQLKMVGLSDQEEDFNRVKVEILQLRKQKVQIQLKNMDREEKRQRIEEIGRAHV